MLDSKNIDRAIKAVVNEYPKLTGTDVCSFALINKTTNAIVDFQRACVCHAPLNRDYKDCDELITSYPVVDEDLDIRFFNFMKYKMYKNYSDHFHCEQTKDGKYYIRVTDLDTIPANLLFNFCICSRVIREHRNQLAVWKALADQGLDEAFAFAVCQTDAGSSLDKTVRHAMSNREHWPFYNTVNLGVLLGGNPYSSPHNYKSHPTECTPTNNIWGDSLSLQKLEGTTIRKFWAIWKDKIT